VDCERASELMCEAVLGDLRGGESQQFHQHVAQCPVCRDEFREVQGALTLAAGSAGVSVPGDLTGRIAGPARSELAAIQGQRRRRRVAVAAAAAAALLSAVWLFNGRRTTVTPRPPCTCWRFVRGDAGNSRWAPLETPCAPQSALWTHRVQGVPGTYKPLAWKDLVIIGTRLTRRSYRGGGAIEAVEIRSGGRRWRREFRSGDFYKAKAFPDRCIEGGRLFVTDGSGCLVLDAMTGRDLGRFDPPAESLGWWFLTASESRLYGAARDGRTIFCLDARTGETIWSRSLRAAVFVPALCGGSLYAYSDTGALLAVDAATGRDRWRRPRAGPAAPASVHARGDRVLVLSKTDEILAFSAADGDLLWRRRVPEAFVSGLALGETAVYTAGGCVALDLADGDMLWEPSGEINGICSAPTVAGHQVLAPAGARAGRLRVLTPSGQLLAGVDGVARQACDGAIVSGGRIYLVGSGQLVAVPCRPTG